MSTSLIRTATETVLTRLLPVAVFALAHMGLLVCVLSILCCDVAFKVVQVLNHMTLIFRVNYAMDRLRHALQLILLALQWVRSLLSFISSRVAEFCVMDESGMVEEEFCPLLSTSQISGGVARRQTNCTICLDTVNADEKIRYLKQCSHSFHARCIEKWFCYANRCPLCCTPIVPC
ncbi:unnamed protein product [Agarophyton chilense]